MTYHFGDFRFDATERLLFRGADRVPLVPKVADTLHVLLERHGQVIEKADLMQRIWPDATVEEIGLARNISLLRKALDDEAPDSPIIETVPRRGYRFAAPVTVGTPSTPRRRRWPLLLLFLLATAAVIYYQFYVPSRFVSTHRAAALAVVPFPCACPGIDADAYTDALTDLLVADLSQTPTLQLVAPSTVRRHQRAGMSMGLMGRLLGLDALVEGSVQLAGPDLRTTVRLVDVHTGKVIWSETIHQPAANPAAAQTATARHAATQIAARLLNH